MSALPCQPSKSCRPIPAVTVVLTVMLLACAPGAVGAAPSVTAADRDEYFRGRIVAIERTDVQELAGNEHLMQLLRVRIRDRAGREHDVRAEHSVPLVLARDQALRRGEEVTVARTRATWLAAQLLRAQSDGASPVEQGRHPHLHG